MCVVRLDVTIDHISPPRIYRHKPLTRQALQYAALHSERAFALETIRKNAHALQYAALQGERAFALEAIRKNAQALQYAALQGERAFALEAIGKNAQALQYAVQKDDVFVKEAMGKNGMALRWASSMQRSNFDIVLAAVQHDGEALQFAQFFKSNKTILDAATKQIADAKLGGRSLALANDEAGEVHGSGLRRRVGWFLAHRGNDGDRLPAPVALCLRVPMAAVPHAPHACHAAACPREASGRRGAPVGGGHAQQRRAPELLAQRATPRPPSRRLKRSRRDAARVFSWCL